MLILGIETSCDETAAAVVRDGVDVLSNVVASQHEIHTRFGGVVPELASRAHCENILPVVESAIASASVRLSDIDAIAVGHRPGLIGSLLVGVAAAKSLAWSLGKPLIGVDHVHAHLYAGLLHQSGATGQPETHIFPALGLVVSGGHTSIYRLDSWVKLQRLGATIDDALGEAYDKVATILGLPYPGGPNLDALAQAPGADERVADLPISRLSPTSLDFSFSGLKTAMLYEVRGVPDHPAHHRAESRYLPPPPLTDERRRDLAATFQRAAAKTVILKLERALYQLRDAGVKPNTLLTGGGVTANSRLRHELSSFASVNQLRLHLPALRFCVDNAAMIAGLAYHHHQAGKSSDLTLEPVPTTAN
ncbi:MAG: tRNA (adenosine(37)-N6)-threonylcarbamoyltransferase complex transferase subunit TsaD [Phycisphaeraceae bacterium]|nr:tRNA (adenosine(37)-N6)-threonylcarbamoyltransferase complex transferase subunit TsaD [Phycisphaeraceae bacterium]